MEPLSDRALYGTIALLAAFLAISNSIANLLPERDVRELTQGADVVNACVTSTSEISPFNPSSLTIVEGIVKGKVLAAVLPGDGTLEVLLEIYNPDDHSQPCQIQVTVSPISGMEKDKFFIADKQVKGIDVDSIQIISENQYNQIEDHPDPERGT